MDPEQEPDPEMPEVPAVGIPKPPMRVETANKWVTLLADYLDVHREAARQGAFAEANRKWDRVFSRSD